LRVLALLLCFASPLLAQIAQTTPGASPPETSRDAAAAGIDPAKATSAYLAKVDPEARSRSDAYFEGGYWLQLWDFLLAVTIAWLLLSSRISRRLRDRVESWTSRRWLQTLLYAIAYILITALLTFPMTVYEGFFREHQYGLSNQTFGAWLREAFIGLGVGLVMGGFGLVLLYAVLRKTPNSWWIWGSLVCVTLLLVLSLIFPVFIAPLFNTYTPLQDAALREKILTLARANGIPAHDVYQVDASRQTKRVSANVSGFAGTLRISLNDNLLRRCSPAEIQAVMGHEMGHYVLNHIYKGLVFSGVLLFAGFAFARWAFQRSVDRWGTAWGVRGVGDVAGLPLLAALLTIYSFATFPIQNTLTRTQEAEADLFGLNATRQPDGAAQVALKLGEYRKLAPGPLEEWVFFDHPSGRNRIFMAMRWKAEHLHDPPPYDVSVAP
jgi:STE24 endopeptidase